MVDAGDNDRAAVRLGAIAPGTAERFDLSRVGRLDLRVEATVQRQDRLVHAPDQVTRVECDPTPEPERVSLSAHVVGNEIPAAARGHGVEHALLQFEPVLTLVLGQGRGRQRRCLALERDLAPGAAGGVHERHCCEPVRTATCGECNGAGVAITDHGDAAAVDVISAAQPLDDAQDIVRILGDPGALGAAAAAAHAARVVADDDVAGARERARELCVEGNAVGDVVAILRAGAGREDDRRRTPRR